MALDKIVNRQEWQLGKAPQKGLVNVTLHFLYPAAEALVAVQPKARKQLVSQLMQQHLEDLMASGIVYECVPILVGSRPAGATCKLPVAAIPELCELPAIEKIHIDSIDTVKNRQVRRKKAQQFFCVKTTFVVQIEGVTQGLQMYEERHILIKADSCEQACQKVKASSAEYGKPYLNPDGYLVRWQLESVDDCYETSLTKLAEFTNPLGVEVFSTLKRRRLTSERVWNGEID